MSGRAGGLTAALAIGLALALLVALGSWQLVRRAEKQALVAAVEARAFGAALPLPPASAWPGLDLARIDYQKVRVTGAFAPHTEFHLYGIGGDSRTARAPEPGWFLFVPFTLAEGGSVLVNRGFVPYARKERSTRPQSAPPAGLVTLEGLVRRPERAGLFAAVDDAARNTYFTRDAASFARAADLGPVAPFTIDQTTPNPGGIPEAGLTRIRFPDNHLAYALTWYALAVTLLGVAGAVWRARRRRSLHAGAGAGQAAR